MFRELLSLYGFTDKSDLMPRLCLQSSCRTKPYRGVMLVEKWKGIKIIL